MDASSTPLNHPANPNQPSKIIQTSNYSHLIKIHEKEQVQLQLFNSSKKPQKSSTVGHLLLPPHAARAQLPFRGLCRGERREAFLVEDPLGLEAEVRVYPLWVIILW